MVFLGGIQSTAKKVFKAHALGNNTMLTVVRPRLTISNILYWAKYLEATAHSSDILRHSPYRSGIREFWTTTRTLEASELMHARAIFKSGVSRKWWCIMGPTKRRCERDKTLTQGYNRCVFHNRERPSIHPSHRTVLFIEMCSHLRHVGRAQK